MHSIHLNHSAEWLKDKIDDFPGAKVLVLGDIILDEYIWGEVSRISPEAPVPVVEVRRETRLLGGAANVIHNMASLGAKPILCGLVGPDRRGKAILERIAEMGLPTAGILVEPDRPTSVKTRIVAQSQQVVRFDRESKRRISTETLGRLLRFIEGTLDGLDAVVVSDYGKGVVSKESMEGLKELLISRSTLLAVDPKTENFDLYAGVDLITPNHHEAGAYCGFKIEDEESLSKAGEEILRRLNCRTLLITQGKDGMTLFEDGGGRTHIPTSAREVFDVTGAGDTVIATLSLGLASGLDLKSSAVISNLAAGIVVGGVGTSVVRAEQLKEAVDASLVPGRR